MSYTPFKMKGNPFQRNFGIGESPIKDTDKLQEEARKKSLAMKGEWDKKKADKNEPLTPPKSELTEMEKPGREETKKKVEKVEKIEKKPSAKDFEEWNKKKYIKHKMDKSKKVISDKVKEGKTRKVKNIIKTISPGASAAMGVADLNVKGVEMGRKAVKGIKDYLKK
jgi:hypothetical protein